MKGPGGKYLFGFVKIGEKGQILIPKEARDIFNLKPGDQLLLLGDETQGLALVKTDAEKLYHMILSCATDPDQSTPGGDNP